MQTRNKAWGAGIINLLIGIGFSVSPIHGSWWIASIFWVAALVFGGWASWPTVKANLVQRLITSNPLPPVIHDGVRWKALPHLDTMEGPFCLDDGSPLGFIGFGGSSRTLPAEGENRVGKGSELFCPVCLKRFGLGTTAESTRFIDDSRNEAADLFLPLAQWPPLGIHGLTISVSNQKKFSEGEWLPKEMRAGADTWASTFIGVAVDAKFDPAVPMLLMKMRLLIKDNMLIRPLSTSIPQMPIQIHRSETYSPVFRIPHGKVIEGGTIQAAVWVLAEGKYWLSKQWPVVVSVNIVIPKS